MNSIFDLLKHNLIVSCQAEGDSPFNSAEGVTAFALSSKQGGAVAIRTEGIEKSSKVIQQVGLPVIGLVKSTFPDGSVCITGSLELVFQLLDVGCNIVAVDGTQRIRQGLTGPEFIQKVKKERDCILMADIATFDDALRCFDVGVDCVSTTLSGYTPETIHKALGGPDFELIESLGRYFGSSFPVFAEGRVNTPHLAAQVLQAGAWAVVVGSAITRPHIITKWFVNAIKK